MSTRAATSLYNPEFYAAQASGSAASARRVVPQVRQLLGPRSVLDVGCGVGTWLREWQEIGVTDVFGVDGTYVDPNALRIPADRFLGCDLQQGFDLGRRFDLVMSLEVAEHLPASAASAFVASLTRHGDAVLFSAAVPGQGGTGHVNEQWPSYWAAIFAAHGYEPVDVLRSKIWGDASIDFWYRQNLLIFARPPIAAGLRQAWTPEPLDIVHPELLGRIRAVSRRDRFVARARRFRAVQALLRSARRLRGRG